MSYPYCLLVESGQRGMRNAYIHITSLVHPVRLCRGSHNFVGGQLRIYDGSMLKRMAELANKAVRTRLIVGERFHVDEKWDAHTKKSVRLVFRQYRPPILRPI